MNGDAVSEAGASPAFDLVGELPLGGRILIEASAGTGKTHALATLAVRYIAEEGVPVEQLLVVTFSRFARSELRDRVRERLVESLRGLRSVDPLQHRDELVRHLASDDHLARVGRLTEALAGFDAAVISTIHGFAQQALATLGSRSSGDPDARLVNDANELLDVVAADLLAAAAISRPGEIDKLPSRTDLVALAKSAFANPLARIDPSGADLEACVPRTRAKVNLLEQMRLEVARRRRRAGELAYDDLLAELDESLSGGGETLSQLQRRFRVALIDEFQDTDPVQWRIFGRLFPVDDASRTMVLVGDPKQAIYAFRGANVHSYLSASADPHTRRFALGTNWRSDAALLGALETLLDGATFGDDAIRFTPVHAAERDAERSLEAEDREALPAIALRVAAGPGLASSGGAFALVDDARRAVVHDLAEHVRFLLDSAWLPATRDSVRRRVRPSDIAVLTLTNKEAEPIERALRARGIPAVVRGGASVLESQAVAHLRDLLVALVRPSDPARARAAALSWFGGFDAASLATADDERIGGFQTQLASWSDELAKRGVASLRARVWAESGVVARVLRQRDGDRNMTDLAHLAGLLQSQVAGRPATPTSLLDALDRLGELQRADADQDVLARQIETEAASVQILTVHKSKGLEFPIVCVPYLWSAPKGNGFYQDPDTDERVLVIDHGTKWGGAIEYARRDLLLDAEAEGDNLRLLYVALTRAQHHCALWWSRYRYNDDSGLTKVLFARNDDRVDLGLRPLAKGAVPFGPDAVARILTTLRADARLEVTLVDAPAGTPKDWVDPDAPASVPMLARARLARRLDRGRRRWSFSAMAQTREIAFAAGHDAEPGADDLVDDAGATDESLGASAATSGGRAEVGSASATSDLPLGALPGGTSFGTLVHEILSSCDFATPDVATRLGEAVRDQIARSGLRIAGPELARGLAEVLTTPLGPLFDGRRLIDVARSDRLDEVGFDLRLGEGGRRASEREIGVLVCRHLASDDPLFGWAARLATARSVVDLAGHLTGSIDLVVRVRDEGDDPACSRYVLADYKTNLLGPRDRLPQSTDYRPELLAAAMADHDYPLQALLYSVALHRYLRWRVRGYEPGTHLGGAAFLFVRAMSGPNTSSTGDGGRNGVFSWAIPPALVVELSDLLDGRSVPA